MGRWHAHAILRAGGRLAAVADLNLDTAKRLADRYPGADIFPDVTRMLNRIPLQVLHVCTPPSTHYDVARQGIDAGANLLIEKPMTPQAAETDRLLQQTAHRGVRICPVHQFIFQDGVLEGIALLPEIGRLVHIEGIFSSAGGTGQPQDRLDEIVADILPHPLSLIQKFLPQGIGKTVWSAVRPGPGEIRIFGEMTGITLSIFISMNSRPTQCSFEIRGTAGTLHLDLFHGCGWMEPGKVSRTRKIFFPFEQAWRRTLTAATNLAWRTLRWEPAYPGLQRLVRSFYESLRNGGESPISNEDILVLAQTRDLLLQKAGSLQGNS